MKKLITLLLVLTGMVSTASAWNSAVLHYDGHWNSDDVYFNKINDVEFYIQLDGSVVNNGSFYFRFAVKGDGGSDVLVEKEPDTSTHNVDQEVTTSAVTSNYNSWTGEGHTTKAWYITQDAAADKIEIYIKWANDTWNITAVSLYKRSITWDNTDSGWSTVKAFSFDENLGDHRNIYWLGDWSGKGDLTVNGNLYTAVFYGTSSVKAIFNNGNSGAGNQTENLNVMNNAVYNKTNIKPTEGSGSYGPVGVKATISSEGYATFSSTKDVDFTNVTGLTARKGKVNGTKIEYTDATTLEAGEGVLLKGEAGDYVIPFAAEGDYTDATNEFVGIPYVMQVTQNMGGKNAYILAKVGEPAVLGFYRPYADGGSWCRAGSAYLATGTATSREFFALDDESVTGVEELRNSKTEEVKSYYNLNGQRVAQPTKGLYIVNGKKAIVK